MRLSKNESADTVLRRLQRNPPERRYLDKLNPVTGQTERIWKESALEFEKRQFAWEDAVAREEKRRKQG